jgi:hypothetical protein
VLNGSINMSSPAAAEGKKPNLNPANQSNPSAQSGSAPTPSGEALKMA